MRSVIDPWLRGSLACLVLSYWLVTREERVSRFSVSKLNTNTQAVLDEVRGTF